MSCVAALPAVDTAPVLTEWPRMRRTGAIYSSPGLGFPFPKCGEAWLCGLSLEVAGVTPIAGFRNACHPTPVGCLFVEIKAMDLLASSRAVLVCVASPRDTIVQFWCWPTAHSAPGHPRPLPVGGDLSR